MIIVLSETQRHVERMRWVAHVTDFFVGCLDGATPDDFDDAVMLALSLLESGHSGARSAFLGYDMIRQRIQSRNKVIPMRRLR